MPKLLFAIIALLPGAVAAFGQAPPLTVTPVAFQFSYQSGTATLPAAQTLQVQSAPAGLNFTVAISGSPFNAAWLLASVSSGKAPATVKVQVNPTGLPAGSYVGTLTFTTIVATLPVIKIVTVTLNITSPPSTVMATPVSLNFSYTTGGPIPAVSLASAFVLSSSGSALTAAVSVKGATWLTVTPTGNISLVGLLNTIAVTVDPTGLAPKVYTGQITISAPAAANKTVTVNVNLTVNASPPQVTGNWPAGLIQGSPASTVTVSGSNYYSTSTISATGFTPETTITASDGLTTVAETFFVPVYQAAATALRVGVASPLPGGTVGTAYSQPLAGAGGTGPYTFALVAGLLPPGLSVVGSNLSGTPSAAGSYFATVQVTDSASAPARAYAQLKLLVVPALSATLRITGAASPLALGRVGTAYGPVTLTAAGGTGGPYTWTAANLPTGLTLSAAGVLSGTPSTDGALGPITGSVVSDTAVLANLPAAFLASAGILRLTVSTPAPGGGASNEAQFQVYGPGPQILAVTNSASLTQGTLAPGELTTIFGLGLGPAALTIFDASTPPLPVSLPSAGSATSVTINGTAAPVLYTMATQVGVIVPYTVGGASAQVVVTYGGVASQPFTVAVAPVDPGIYSLASSGQGPGAILNFNSTTGDYTVNSAAAPATRGSTIVIYITGTGATSSAVYNLLVPASPAVTSVLAPSLTIGGLGASVLAAQAPPGSVPGLMQINASVPALAPIGAAVPVVVTIGGVSSQTGLTMAIK
jgi:uncharacterized protein (TIGR03437 family)